jgi:hypothetical protein
MLIACLALAFPGCVSRAEHDALILERNALRLERDGLAEQLAHANQSRPRPAFGKRQLEDLLATTRPALPATTTGAR